ncbi:cytochrome b5 [candidate division KSB1 bacterium]|nr:cytochrome b5 [candidate division KSB1 bacterium]
MELDKKKLEENNGKDGKPTYVVVDGKVYDLSESKLWRNGVHMNRHHSGQDLSASLEAAPHGKEVLEKFKQIGTFVDEMKADVYPLPAWLNKLVNSYPFLKRHPHPMIVHFPMAFFIAAALFLAWYYLVSPLEPMLDSALYLHVLGILSIPFAIASGWLSWRINYLGKSNPYIKRKIYLTFLLFVLTIIALIMMVNNPLILKQPQGLQLVVPVIIFLYLPIVSIIGQHGGKLVYD